MNKNILDIEEKIDAEFANSPLAERPYSQAVWTLLSVFEDLTYKVYFIDKQSSTDIGIWNDVMLNSITHPLRILHKSKCNSTLKTQKLYISEYYGWAYHWLLDARTYNEFCTIFPLCHSKLIEWSINGNVLNIVRKQNIAFQYEAYNRIVVKNGEAQESSLDTTSITGLLLPHVTVNKNEFDITLTPQVVDKLVDICSSQFNTNFKLPNTWETSGFTFGEFRKVFETIRSILIGRFIIRAQLANNGLIGCGYTSIVWVIPLDYLITALTQYTNIGKVKIKNVLDYLTFGNKGVRCPDIMHQPLIDLADGNIALSPSIWMSSDAERNLCVLLNKIDSERNIYSKLIEEKENIFRQEIKEFINKNKFDYDIKFGDLGCTDLDIAIIDRENKVCICMELKWFIEPAEVREIKEKSEELVKGAQVQAKKILKLYLESDKKLLSGILNISNDYDFSVVVGSRNWIGNYDVQDNDVPIIKVGHFLEKLKELRSLKEVAKWLKNRTYLPLENNDFRIVPLPLKLSKWECEWYGIDIL